MSLHVTLSEDCSAEKRWQIVSLKRTEANIRGATIHRTRDISRLEYDDIDCEAEKFQSENISVL